MKKNLLYKRCTALIAFAFVWLGASAYTISNGVCTITPADLANSGLQSRPENGNPYNTIKLVGNFGQGWGANWFGDNGGQGTKNNVSTIDLSEARFNDDPNIKWGFSNFRNLTTIIWPDGVYPASAGNIRYLPSYAFKQCGIEEVHIPGYIKHIYEMAFDEASSQLFLKKVYFDEWEGHSSEVKMRIDTHGFSNTYGLTEVRIYTLGEITANQNAFPHMKTFGHGDPSRDVATLFYPPERTALYVNLHHKLNAATAADTKKYHEWLVDHYTYAKNEDGSYNGFYEFIRNAEIITREWGDQFIMTYSHTFNTHLVPPGVKAYIVNKIEKQADASDPTTGTVTLTLKKVNAIPAGSGVILIGSSNAVVDGKKTLLMATVGWEGEVYTSDASDDSYRNYLTATASVGDHDLLLKPYMVDQYGQVTRQFIMGKFSDTDSGQKYYDENGNYGTGAGLDEGDWVGFFRTKEGFIVSGKAYLNLTNEQYPFPNGGEIIVKYDDQVDASNEEEYYRTEWKNDNNNFTKFSEDEMKENKYWWLDENTQLTWAGLWGTRQLKAGFTMAKYNGELEDEEWMEFLNSQTDGISAITAEENGNDAIYTLQGVKVAHPTKGVFIKNGKKYIVK